jgi:hypothetical protein
MKNDFIITKVSNIFKTLIDNFKKNADHNEGWNILFLILVSGLLLWSFFWISGFFKILFHVIIFIVFILILISSFC